MLYKMDTLRPMRSPNDLESYDLGIGKRSPDSHKWMYEQQKGTRKIIMYVALPFKNYKTTRWGFKPSSNHILYMFPFVLFGLCCE